MRYEDTSSETRYRFDFTPGDDGLYVMAGIFKHARLLREGVDYRVEGNEIVFARAPGTVIDIYAQCAWPERFTRDDIEKRRKKCRTLNYWDSQYQLEAKPLTAGTDPVEAAAIKQQKQILTAADEAYKREPITLRRPGRNGSRPKR
ncbi:transcription termination factor domain protein [Burkholderia thailandensis USAMRU Malaysia |uniref:hypothetical protein n=1 Tax=Burkholderia thailandensis TaxID=57975 RepID=UPI0003ECAD82|nr:hypothetical protein [Burkholderia thailandensis]AHI79045.1 transcription termination factor domain protein [Burkholderia thailandensis E444]AIC88762.1 transcription termination factor domain protein [Burkholderia thailandensis USAMRU Malaysia \